MENSTKVLDKIKKLLALAGNNPEQAEAAAALAKAQELMAKFGVQESDLDSTVVKYACKPAKHSNNEGYRSPLAMVIGPNFRCKVIIIGGTIHFFGHESDVDICVEVFNYAYKVSHNQGLKLEREARKAGNTTHGVANSYWLGFIDGLKKAFDAQSTALMIIVPNDVNTEFDTQYPSTELYKGGMSKHISYNGRAYNQGVTDGKSHLNSRRIEG